MSENSVQEYRDYLSSIFSMFVFSAGASIRSISDCHDKLIAYICTVAFVVLFMIYIFMRYGIKGINQKRKIASGEGIVTREEHEKIQAAKAEIYIVENFESIDYIRITILAASFIFLVFSIR